MKKLGITILLLLSILSPYVFAGDVYVATNGSDSNNGSINSPYATIQKAVSKLDPGETCYIRGGSYHEEVVIDSLNGTAENPITFTNYEDEAVTMDGTIPISTGWTQHSGNIYKTTLTQDIWQLIVNGEWMINARWPNANFDDESIWHTNIYGASGINGTLTSFDDSPHNGIDLASSGLDMTGAMVVFAGRKRVREITTHSAGSSSVICNAADRDLGGSYYIECKLNLLNAEKEWYYNPATKELYLWSPGGGVPTGDIRGKVQDFAFNSDGCDYLIIDGLDFFGTTTQSKNADHVEFRNCDFLYPACSKRMLLDPETSYRQTTVIRGSYGKILNCSFAKADAPGAYMRGDGNIIENCQFEDIDYSRGPAEWGLYSIYQKGANCSFIRNTFVGNAGAGNLLYPSTGTGEIKLNRTGVKFGQPGDVALFHYMTGVGPTKFPPAPGVYNRNASYNWLYDSISNYGLRFDGDPAGGNGSIHHNMTWNMGAFRLKGDNSLICNNGGFDHTSTRGSYAASTDKMYGYQNLSTMEISPLSSLGWPYTQGRRGVDPAGNPLATYGNYNSISNNNAADLITVWPLPGINLSNYNANVETKDMRQLLRDPDNWDFRPRADAIELIDQGQVITGITDGFMGIAPDIGAYEYGDINYWIPGRKLEKASTPIPPDGTTTAKADADLIWLEGYEAVSHNIYWGTTPGSLSLKGNQTNNIFDMGTLTSFQTYYWRIDTVTASGTITGDEWSFAVENTTPILSTTFAPSDDSYVDEASPDSKYGSNVEIELRTPITSSIRHGYMKFMVDIPPASVVKRATLRLYNAAGNPVSGGLTVHSMSDTSWSEGDITWNNRPAIDGDPLDSGTLPSGGFWDYDVTVAVTGNGAVSFGLIRGLKDSQRSVNSKEKVGWEPVLTVDYQDSGLPQNNFPSFDIDPIIEPNAMANVPYSGSIADHASDPDAGDILAFDKRVGTTWLTVATDGTLSGIPGTADIGLNYSTVQVIDDQGYLDETTLVINVLGNPDINGDSNINNTDFAKVAANWLDNTCTAPTWCDGADLDISGTVDIEDLKTLAASWLD